MRRINTHKSLLPATFCTAAILSFFLLISACSDQRAISQLPETHPDTWMNQQSPDFHGAVARQIDRTSCSKCHGTDYAGGRVGVSCLDCHLSSGACTACHGVRDNSTGAPPPGLRGQIDDTTLAVGAHTMHLSGTPEAAAVSCSSCHLVPYTMFESSHLDLGGGILDSIAEITWQGYSDGGGASWDRNDRTCTGTYCHGNFTGGIHGNAPIWTAPDQALCGSCHDTGPGAGILSEVHQIHYATLALRCANCHSTVVDTTLAIVEPALHVNGSVDVQASDSVFCDQCHGTTAAACTHCHGGNDNPTGAPPRGLRGELLASQLAVGAHTTHVEGSYISAGFSCSECHVTPTRLTDPGHWEVDSLTEITWGPLAGSASQWDHPAQACRTVYCHGNFSGGYAANSPIWTAPGQAACGSCHDDGASPFDLGGRHGKHVVEEQIECYQCHAATVNSGLSIINKSVHVDGIKTVSFSSGQGTFQNGRCSNIGCHDNEDW